MNNLKLKNRFLLVVILIGLLGTSFISAKTPIKKTRIADTITALGEAFSFQMNGMELDILFNDKINGNTIIAGTNATVSQVGNWPTGIYINTSGKAVVVAGTVMPRVPLTYKITSITDPNISVTAQLILYDVTNKFDGYDFYVWNEVDKNCYTSNVNEITGTLHMVYIGSSPMTISSSTANGNKFRINLSGYNIVDATLWDSRLHYSYYKNQITLQPFEELTFPFKKDSGTILDSYDIKLPAVRFGTMDGRDIAAAPGKVVDNYSTITVYKTPKQPNNKTTNASVGHNVTLLDVSGLSTTEAQGYVFYDNNNIEVPYTTLFPNSAAGTYEYFYVQKNSAGCVGQPAKLTLNVSSSNIDAGLINIGGVTGIVEKSFCQGSTVEIMNQDHAGSTLGTTYSWEMSEDEGNTWTSLSQTPGLGATYSYSTSNLILYSNIKITDISKTLWLKRKTYRTLDTSVFNYSNIVKINIENNIISFPNNVKSYSVALNATFAVPTISASIPGSTIKVYNSTPTTVSGNLPTNVKGTFTYTVEATTPAGCKTSDQFTLTVYDIRDCVTKTRKIYASKTIPWTSGASKTFFAEDSQVKNVSDATGTYLSNNAGYASLSGGVVALGIGTVGLDLFFVKQDGSLYSPAELKGKSVTLKLGEQYSGLKVAGGLSVIGRKTTAANSADIDIDLLTGNTSSVGITKGVKGGVLDLLKGDNVFTFTFTPKTINGQDVEYNGIRVQLGSLLAVADLASVFYAYIEEDINTTSITGCTQEDIRVTPLLYHIDNSTATPLYPETQSDIDNNVYNVQNTNFKLNNFTQDITWGNRSEVLNVASSLSSVVHPYFAVDNDYNTYALFNATVGVLNQQFLQIHLRQRAEPGDQVRLVLSYPNINLINLSLLQLGNFKLVYYLGDTVVGEDPLEQFRILDLGLFNLGNHKRAVLTKPVTIPFDRVEIRQFQTINVNIGDGLHIYDVRIQPQMLFEGQVDPKQITTICAAEPLAIQKPSLCTTFEVSFSEVKQWGNQLSDEDGNPLFETGTTNPIKSILEIQDIPNTTLSFTHQTNNSNGTFTDNFHIQQLFKQYEKDGIILLKVQAIRQGCTYGEPEYLKIRLKNCRDAVANPTLRVLSN